MPHIHIQGPLNTQMNHNVMTEVITVRFHLLLGYLLQAHAFLNLAIWGETTVQKIAEDKPLFTILQLKVAKALRY